jgi:hypothetical protein
VEDLDRHRAVVLDVIRQVDGSHAARPELGTQSVTLGQRRTEELGLVTHQRLEDDGWRARRAVAEEGSGQTSSARPPGRKRFEP